MTVIPHGEDARLDVCRRRLLLCEGEEGERLCRFDEIHLLPIPTRAYPLSPRSDLCRRLLVGYALPSGWEAYGCRAIDLEADEIFLEENARLTALGTVGHLLTESSRALYEMKIGILGLGRIGRHLLRYLTLLDAKVVIYSSKAQGKLPEGVEEVTVRWDVPPDATLFSGLDVLINTAPTPIRCESLTARVIDLASGVSIPKSVPHTKLPSLPARLYHESAGFTVYRAILRNL